MRWATEPLTRFARGGVLRKVYRKDASRSNMDCTILALFAWHVLRPPSQSECDKLESNALVGTDNCTPQLQAYNINLETYGLPRAVRYGKRNMSNYTLTGTDDRT